MPQLPMFFVPLFYLRVGAPTKPRDSFKQILTHWISGSMIISVDLGYSGPVKPGVLKSAISTWDPPRPYPGLAQQCSEDNAVPEIKPGLPTHKFYFSSPTKSYIRIKEINTNF